MYLFANSPTVDAIAIACKPIPPQLVAASCAHAQRFRSPNAQRFRSPLISRYAQTKTKYRARLDARADIRIQLSAMSY